MEGLQYRTIKLWSKGEPIEEIYRIIADNTRFPQELMGDIEAQLGGCLLGRDLTATLADKFGVATYRAALDDDPRPERGRDRANASAPSRTASMRPSRSSTTTACARSASRSRCKVIVAGDDMTIDYSEISDQVRGCINSGYHGGGVTTARIAFMYLIATGEPANEGTFRPLKLILPEGKIVSARPTAPMGMYGTFPFPTIVDTFIKALEKALPDRVTGAHFGTYSSVGFAGTPRRRHALPLPRQRPRRLGRVRQP